MWAIYSCKKPGESFVRKFQSAPEEISVLATDTQINVTFCVLPNLAECTPLSVITFSVGDFWVTVTWYKNKKLKNKERNNPVHIGPIQIHYWKFVWSYRFIRISFKPISKKVSGLKIFISDQEDNLVNAFKEEFPEAINLQFFIILSKMQSGDYQNGKRYIIKRYVLFASQS